MESRGHRRAKKPQSGFFSRYYFNMPRPKRQPPENVCARKKYRLLLPPSHREDGRGPPAGENCVTFRGKSTLT